MLIINDVGRSIGDDTENVTELARRRDGLQARLDELGRMFATGDIDASQLRSGSAELHQQLAGINSLLASLLRTSPAANLLNGDGDLRAQVGRHLAGDEGPNHRRAGDRDGAACGSGARTLGQHRGPRR